MRARLRTPAEVAHRLGVSPSTVLRYFDSGLLAGADMSPADKRRGRHRRMPRFRDEDVDAFVAGMLQRRSARS